MELKDLVKIIFDGPISFTVGNSKVMNAETITFTVEDPAFTAEDPVKHVMSLVASAGAQLEDLGSTGQIAANVHAAIYQDDDAHENCSLTACLDPLHPGPCKGWKGNLFKTAPQAWHALEAARVEKANANRLKKIEHLKSQGLPIPKKLLTPHVAKPHPHAGQTANKASGGAHEAGKEVTQNAGVHLNAPGKVTLGQASKTVTPSAPVEKGPKGKKPTLASKGIAFMIGQEKVTPQYKLDKAAAITPEQWAGLSGDDKSLIRGELVKIQKDGFGPQQKKATELLDKLPAEGKPDAKPTLAEVAKAAGEQKKAKIAELIAKHEAEPPKITKLSEPTLAQKIGDLKPGTPDTITTPSGKTYQKVSLKDTAPKAASTDAQADAMLKLTEAIPGVKAGSMNDKDKLKQVIDKLKESGPLTEHTKMKLLVSKLANSALHAAHEDKMPGVGHGEHDAHIGTFHKEISEHIEQGKPGLPPLVAKMAAHHEAVKAGVEKAAKEAHQAKVDAAKIENKVEKPKELPKHVQHAMDMADGKASGASWSKNHLAAYQPLTADEFHALSPQHQTKIVSELEKAQVKFLDPKKQKAAADLLEKFGHGAGAPKAKAPEKTAEPISMATHLHDHSVSEKDAKKAASEAPISAHFDNAKKVAGVTDAENPDGTQHPPNSETAAKELANYTTKMYDSSITSQPEVKKAEEAFKQAITAELHARTIADAKKKAFNKISSKLYADGGPAATSKLSPIEKASLKHYQDHILKHPMKTSDDDIAALGATTAAAKKDLTDKLQAALKEANAPKPEDMSGAQLDSKVKELLGSDIVDPTKPKISLSLLDTQYSKKLAESVVGDVSKGYPPHVLADPAVAAKLTGVQHAATQYLMTGSMHVHLKEHIKQLHDDALKTGEDVHGNPLSAADKKIIELHAAKLEKDHAYLDKTASEQLEKLDAAKAQFKAAAEKAAAQPAEPAKLSDYDKTTVDDAFAKAWSKHASKAVTFGVNYESSKLMKAHPEYQGLTQDLGNLKVQAGKVAVAHAETTVAYSNVPIDPDTGHVVVGSPEWATWQGKIYAQQDAEKTFNAMHKQAQAKLDTIRVAAGLKKRALPKVDAPAVKAAAAESGFYTTAAYGAPNYGKAASAKGYMLAKVGEKLGVKHQSAQEKKTEKLVEQMAKEAPTGSKVTPSGKYIPPPTTQKTKDQFPSVAEAGDTPSQESAEKYGFGYVSGIGAKVGDWPGDKGGAYVASDDHFKDFQARMSSPDIQHGLAAQKSFKWSIGNMEGKGSPAGAKGSLYSYTGSGYDAVNTKLNGLPPGATKTGSTTISNIDKGMAASPALDTDVVLYRGFKSPHTVFSSGKWNDVNVAGMEWTQKSYSSTSGALSTAQSFAGYGGVVMRILVPKERNVHGINAKGGQHPGESEIILQRGLRYRVVADHGKHGNARYIDVMVVPDPYAKAE